MRCKRCEEEREDFTRQKKDPTKYYSWCDRCRSLGIEAPKGPTYVDYVGKEKTKSNDPDCPKKKGNLRAVADRHNKRAAAYGTFGVLTPKDLISVYFRCNRSCVRCGKTKTLEFDHIIPLAGGGHNTADNLQMLCHECNAFKGCNMPIVHHKQCYINVT